MLKKLALSQSTITVVSTALVGMLIFLIPSNLFLKFAENSGYVNGLLVDYLLPKLYLSDFPILAIIIWSLFIIKPRLRVQKKRLWLLAGIVAMILLIRQFFSPYPLASLWFFGKLCEMILLTISITSLKKNVKKSWIFVALLLTLGFQNFVSIIQFLTQKSLANYWFFGEANLSHYSGVAKASFNGAEKILPYGTSAHPNILGGVLVFFLVLSFLLAGRGIERKAWLVMSIPTLLLLLLTQSLSAWLMMASAVILLALPKKNWVNVAPKIPLIAAITLLISLILFQVSVPLLQNQWSWQRRATLQKTAISFFTSYPLLGTGLNTNAALNEKTFSKGEIIRFAQPTHHLPLLWLSETGLLGIAVIIVGMRIWQIKDAPILWLMMLPLVYLDHYLLTLQTGLLLLVFLLSFVDDSIRKQTGKKQQKTQSS